MHYLQCTNVPGLKSTHVSEGEGEGDRNEQ